MGVTEELSTQSPAFHLSAAQTARPDRFERVPWGAVVTFVVLAYGLAWLATLPLWLVDPDDPKYQSVVMQLLVQGLTVAMMFTPALATLAVVFVGKQPQQGRARLLGLWPLRPAKRVVWFIVGGLIVPLAVVAASIAVAIACGWLVPDFENFSGFSAMLGGVDVGISVRVLVALQFAMIPVGAIINMIPAFGEELGWRGWLLPALRPLGLWPSLILHGAIWGVWHAPVTLLGHNFGLYDLRGVALMTVGCIFWGILLGWSRLRSGSVWPAVLGHGALNAAGGTILVIAAYDAPLPLPLANPIGVAGWIVLACVIVVLLATRQFGKEPQLAPKQKAGTPN